MPTSDLLIYTHTHTHRERSVVVFLIIFNGLWGYRSIKRVFIPSSYKMIPTVKAVSLEAGAMLTLDG